MHQYLSTRVLKILAFFIQECPLDKKLMEAADLDRIPTCRARDAMRMRDAVLETKTKTT